MTSEGIGADHLPDGWKIVSLGEACAVNPRRPRLDRDDDALTSFVPMAAVDENKGVIADLQARPYHKVWRGYTYFEEEDVLFAKITPSMQNGKSAIARGLIDGLGFGSTEFHVLRPSQKVIPEWVHLFVRQKSFRDEATQYFRGAVGQQRVPAEFLEDHPFPLLPLDEQRRIVARVEELFARIEEARRLRVVDNEDAERLIPAILQEAFANIRDGYEVTTVPKDEVKSISGVCVLQRGKFAHRPRNDPRFFGGSTPWVQIGDIPKDYSKYIKTHMDTLNEDGLAISRVFPKGTLVISIAATIGAVGILEFDACFPDSLVGITPDPDVIDSSFLYWQLRFVQSHLEAVAPYAAQRNINLSILRKLKLWVPPLSRQAEIAEQIDSKQILVAELERTQAKSTEELEHLEQSILARAFRGEL